MVKKILWFLGGFISGGLMLYLVAGFGWPYYLWNIYLSFSIWLIVSGLSIYVFWKRNKYFTAGLIVIYVLFFILIMFLL